MTNYIVQLKVNNGGVSNVFSTTDRQHAACFCKSNNEAYAKAGSPNRYFFDTLEN